MALLEIHPQYRAFLRQHQLVTVEGFLRLPGVIYSGHPDRHVAHVTVGEGDRALWAFVKKEHRVPWRDRWANAWAGFGWVAKSVREMKVLQALHEAGFDCPEVIAAGEENGTAFLLLREIPAALELRLFLQKNRQSSRRRSLARSLGQMLARLHNAGFAHEDLFAKHILVEEENGQERFWFLDWQRGYRRAGLSWSGRERDLATLGASLCESLASPGDRLRFLHAYWTISSARLLRFSSLARRVFKKSQRLLHKRKIRELRQPPLAAGRQNLIWLDGEALCVTRQFREQWPQGQVPEWLHLPPAPPGDSNQVLSRMVGRFRLTQRWTSRPWQWFWARLRRRRFGTPELEQAGTLFRLQRYGVVTPRLLAMGQRFSRPWRSASLLLTEPLRGVPLGQRLSETTEFHQRREILYQTGALVRRLHEAGYVLSNRPDNLIVVVSEGGTVNLGVGSVDGLQRCSHIPRPRVAADLGGLIEILPASKTEALRMFLGYLDCPRLPVNERRWANKILRCSRQGTARRAEVRKDPGPYGPRLAEDWREERQVAA